VTHAVDELQTTRLHLLRMREDDFDDLARMHRDERVMATLGGVRSDAKTQAVLEGLLAHWDMHGFGVWTLREPGTGRFAGRGGLRLLEVEGRPELEVLYGFMPDFWGQGLATEVAAESVRVAFEELGRDELVCFTLPTNLASRRVMEKVGFRYEKDFVRLDLPHVLYRLRTPGQT